jgi:hypothetical protein
MFTQQSGQIENALRSGGVPDISAKEMMQGVANCRSPLEHRGSAAFTRNPRDNRSLFPGQPPTGGTPNFYLSPSVIDRSVIINIPPWQHVPWTPIPYPDYPDWQPIPYPDWAAGQYQWDDVSVIINSPTYMGPVTTNNVTTNNVKSNTINNDGDITNNNTIVNEGPVTINGPVHHNHNVVNQSNVTNKNTVINEGDVYNEGATYTDVSYNYNTTNFGDTTNYGPTTVNQFFSSGPSEFSGDTYIAGDELNVTSVVVNIGGDTTTNVTIEGDTITIDGDTTFTGDVYFPDPSNPGGPPLGPLSVIQASLVTGIMWDGATLTKSYRTFTVLGTVGAEQTSTIVSGVACPSTPLGSSASNYVDMP